MHDGGFARPADQFVGLARHGGDDDGNLVALIDLAFDVARDILDAFNVGNGRAAKLHHNAGHDKCFPWVEILKAGNPARVPLDKKYP